MLTQLYHHGVRLASVHMTEESTITKLRNVVNLQTGLGAIPSEFEALEIKGEISSVTTSCSRALHSSSVHADVVFTEFAILIFLPPICSLGKPGAQLSRSVPASIDLSPARKEAKECLWAHLTTPRSLPVYHIELETF